MEYALYAVTRSGSLYGLSYETGENGWPIVEKIAFRNLTESGVAVGGRLRNGCLVWIDAECIALYDPTPKARLARDIHTGLWGGHTNHPVGLFLRRAEAEKCLDSDGLTAWDQRWRRQTREALETLRGDETFIVDPDFAVTAAAW